MPSFASFCRFGLLLASAATAQLHWYGERDPNAFTYVQPLNTTILGQYGHSEAVYPSPPASGIGGWEAALAKAKDFVSELTLEEKASMVTGQPGPCIGNIGPIPRLNFSGLCLQDGPSSLRLADYVSVFPSGVTIASSWDKELFYARSHAMGREFKAKGAHVILAPSVGPMGRSPYSGRNWESFSPDPYLSGHAMEQSILALRDAGVQATAKHFILNEQEISRSLSKHPNGTLKNEGISSNADDRTVHELYLWPFANAVRAGCASIMCSYQRINGSYACQNSKVLNGLLKQELGFQGYVMSDWWAVHSGVASIESGLDMDMPGFPEEKILLPDGSAYTSFFGGNITTAVRNGTLAVARLDDMITRIMTPYYHLGQDNNYPSVDPSTPYFNIMDSMSGWFQDWPLTGEMSRDVRENHGDLIRKHAGASTILLKNEQNALPLKAPKTIAIIGNDAGPVILGPNYQLDFADGTLAIGGGSGSARFTRRITPLEAIRARAAKDDALVMDWLDNDWVANIPFGPSLWNHPTPPEACLVFLKGWASENVDREFLELDWNATKVVDNVAQYCNNTIVVTHSAGANVLPFADHPNVTAILAAHYPGQETGNSIVDVLYGVVNPSGRLPYTIAFNESDYNTPITTRVLTTGPDDWQSWFTEKLEVDYRYFDANDIPVRYEFGFSLSYTTFSMADIKVQKTTNQPITSAPKQQDVAPGGNPALWDTLYEVEVTLQNTGDVHGASVAQLYITFPDNAPAGTPPLQLRGFDKLSLDAGESGLASLLSCAGTSVIGTSSRKSG